MPVLVKPTKTKLTWGDFGKSSGTFGNEVAEAGYDSGFQPENFTPRQIRKLFYLPATFIHHDLFALRWLQRIPPGRAPDSYRFGYGLQVFALITPRL